MAVTRFAPSPSGPLHLGHAYAALIAADRAGAAGTFLLRIEDLDRARSRPRWETAIADDLSWLGLVWPRPVMRQSERIDAYRAALARLAGLGLLYPCRCSRADIRAAQNAPQEGAPAIGPDGLIYPGTCRGRPMAAAGPDDAFRLDIARAFACLGGRRPAFEERGPLHPGTHHLDRDAMIAEVGDVVLSRPGMDAAYHLAVTVDDAAQGITEVTRGADLLEATRVHRLLQELLELPTPSYFHHDLIRDDKGRRLAKRDDARALATLRAEGATPATIRARLDLAPDFGLPR